MRVKPKCTRKEYVDGIRFRGEYQCPFCGCGQTSFEKETVEELPQGQLSSEIICIGCKAVYREIYTISDVITVSPPEQLEKK